MNASEPPEESGVPETGMLPRSQFQLRSLPIRFRWEVTRRHPYYQDWWRWARKHHGNEPIQYEEEAEQLKEKVLREAAIAILGGIGVTGNPPDPGTSFEDLEAENLNQGWLSGVMHPVSQRGMAGLLLAALPQETLGELGRIFTLAASETPENDGHDRILAMIELSTLDRPGLDMIADEPIVSVNPAASGRQLTDAATELLKQWKEERELQQQRDRSDKYPEYLRVFDMREGWTGSNYARESEKKLRDISRELGLPLSTIFNHYRSAFHIVTGYSFSPETWFRLFASVKLFDVFTGVLPYRPSRRLIASRTPRPVPETRLRSGGKDEDEDQDQGPVTSTPDLSDNQGLPELILDIQTLIDRRLTDEAIARELEMTSDDNKKAIAYIRDRGADFFSD